MVRRTGAWPPPWKRVDEDVEPDEVEWCEVLDANDECVPFVGDLQYEVDQDQIKAVDAMIAAVNHYPALLAAARAVVEGAAIDTGLACVVVDLDLFDALRAAVEAADA